ncbi:MAG TPA: hypothetical protein DCF89_12900 [Flavobacteriales bacterium]|nr:hypothetical protein [Crocinitomicaceae bacterium]HAE32008.1 hypothetical protein [Flavobacteriales bacterium]
MTEAQQLLAENCLQSAREMLIQTDEFYPFGAFLGPTGIAHPLGIEVDKKNIPNNGNLIKQLIDLAKSENFEQYSLCYEVSLQMSEAKPAIDAICVEFSETEAPKVYQPFSKVNNEYIFDDVFAVQQ